MRLLVVRSEDHGDDGPSSQLTPALAVVAVGAAMFTLMIDSAPHVVQGLDESVSSWVRPRDVFDATRAPSASIMVSDAVW